MKKAGLILSCLAAAAIGACGGGKEASAPSDVSSPVTESPSTSASDAKWKDMDYDQRMEFMGMVIMPEMKKMFQAADSEGYKEFGCQTCHGQDGEAVKFKMPNGLYALQKPDPIPASNEYNAEVTKFMMEQVTPKMAELMGMEPGKELNCFSCHEAEE